MRDFSAYVLIFGNPRRGEYLDVSKWKGRLVKLEKFSLAPHFQPWQSAIYMQQDDLYHIRHIFCILKKILLELDLSICANSALKAT